MHFIVNIQREKESRMTSRSRSEEISLGRHALTSIPRLTPRLGYDKACRPRLISSDLELEVILDSHNDEPYVTHKNSVRKKKRKRQGNHLCSMIYALSGEYHCARYNWITMSWWNQRQSTELSLATANGGIFRELSWGKARKWGGNCCAVVLA